MKLRRCPLCSRALRGKDPAHAACLMKLVMEMLEARFSGWQTKAETRVRRALDASRPRP